MMEHVRIFDWCASAPERYFVEEADIDNCTTEKILRNKFVDPLLSSDSEEDSPPNKIDWDQIFKNKKINKSKLFVPCLRPVPPYPRVSELTAQQHTQFLKILCDKNPHIMEDLFIGKPTRLDFKAFEAIKEIYEKEQKAYIEWAKTLWTSDHCIRALRPKPLIETVYEAEFKLRAQRMRTFPKNYDVAAQISLENQKSKCDAVPKQDLIRVTLAEMPQVEIPDKIEKQFGIIRPCTLPEPCQKHPYQIVLPNEETLSILPIVEVHRELATFAMNNGAEYIASENALKCLVQWNRHWLLALSVCETIKPDGERVNVVVLDSEFSVNKEAAPMRTYKAFRHLLEHALIPSSERERIWNINRNTTKKKKVTSPQCDVTATTTDDLDVSSDDDDPHLFIDTGDNNMDSPKPQTRQNSRAKTEEVPSPRRSGRLQSQEEISLDTEYQTKDSESTDLDTGFQTKAAESPGPGTGCQTRPSDSPGPTTGCQTRSSKRKNSEDCPDIGVYSCNCKGTLYEKPPRRSFKKWQFRNKASNENCDIIIHCPHKAKDKLGELILEPIPEYQIDLGASQLTEDSLRSVALSLAIRKHAAVLYARVDGQTGDVATFERLTAEELARTHPDVTSQAISSVQCALSQLRGLLPGHYVLQHEPSHGSNALLLCGRGGSHLQLQFDSSQLQVPDEALMVKTAPTLTAALLPYHKQRRVLPCAFTPYENQIAKEPKKPPPKKKAPPQAIKWPKKKTRKRKK